MIWNKKRIDIQVYKVKKSKEFLIVYPWNFWNDSCDVFCGIYLDSDPKNEHFCHSSASIVYLHNDCYPISQAKLKNYPDWYEFFNNYIKEL